MGERFGELVPDERSAEHDRDFRLGDSRDHGFGFIEVLEVEEVRRPLGAGRAKRVRAAARRDEQAVIRYFSARLGVDGLLVEADLVDLRLETEIDVVLRVPLHVAHVDPLLEKHPAEVPGERYAVVEGVGLVVDHHDLGGGVELS